MSASAAAVTGTSEDPRSDEPGVHHGGPSGLARKLTCTVATATVVGVLLLLSCQVGLTLTAVPSWGSSTKEAMIELERENLERIAEAKAEFISEFFDRVQESVLQLQAFAGQAAVAVPETMTVDSYLTLNSGLLEESEETFEYSVWFVPEMASGDFPEAGSSLEGLLNRSSLMDVPFRGLQRQHDLIYLAALDDPSEPETTQINFQTYAGRGLSGNVGYEDWHSYEECDDRHLDGEFDGVAFEPRCRVWYQDAIEDGNTGAIITNPYIDVDSQILIMTSAAPVFDLAGTQVLGVVGVDIITEGIESSVEDVRVIGDEGYAYVLAPGGQGQVAIHADLAGNQEVDIFDLETDVDEEEFRDILDLMNSECEGSASYSRGDGEVWLLSWSHETASTGSSSASCVPDGFVVVVTVSESALLEVFSKTEDDIAAVVVAAACVMAAVLLVIGCCTAGSARGLATSVTEPVNQLVDVVSSLNRLDFSRQAVGPWIVNDVTSPEVEELMTAFQAMSTVVKFANMSLTSGDVDIAVGNYIEAKVLFTKLGNDRGVSIVHNNLGSAYTLQARQLVAEATQVAASCDDTSRGRERAEFLLQRADDTFCDAVTSFQMAIDDANMLCLGQNQLHEEDGEQKFHGNDDNDDGLRHGEAPGAGVQQPGRRADLEAGAGKRGRAADEDLGSPAALALQLANRKFNLALCLAAKGNSTVPLGGSPDLNAINGARRLMYECAELAAKREDATGDQRHVECLLEVAKLERELQGRRREAGEALDAAERVVQSYHGSGLGGIAAGDVHIGVAVPPPPREGPAVPPPLAALRQQLLAARGTHCVAGGDFAAGVEHWTDAVIGCGDRMDVAAVRISLKGLREQAQNGTPLPHKLLEAVGVRDPQGGIGTSRGHAKGKAGVVKAIDKALKKLDAEASNQESIASIPGEPPAKAQISSARSTHTTSALMQSWIDQAKGKLNAIIEQTKKDVPNIELRVAFVGYRDYGDRVRYEGPYDFHTEAEMPNLLNNLKDIKAVGGKDRHMSDLTRARWLLLPPPPLVAFRRQAAGANKLQKRRSSPAGLSLWFGRLLSHNEHSLVPARSTRSVCIAAFLGSGTIFFDRRCISCAAHSPPLPPTARFFLP
ncbi:unnamed protein product [Scytosiphon promiscuus]